MRCRMIDRLKRVLLLCLMLCAPAAYSASKTLLVLGDSISAEYGLPRESGWVSLLQKRLSDDKLAINVVNASISGETTAGGLTRLPALLQQHKPALLIIELGGNDGLRGLSLAATQANLREMIKSAERIGARVLLLGMRVPPNYGPDYSKRFAAMYQGLGRERNVKLVPFLFAGLEDTDRFFQQDRIHPNQRAQAVMLDTVWPVLRPLLK
ncbi:MAG: arylesterase [Oxalobacteraceae bacterium]|nr:arylesterase [Oxalobacteraceae bacterium]